MVAMILGLLLAAAAASMFIASQRQYRRNNIVADMQSNARIAIGALAADLALAGFFGGSNPGRIKVAEAVAGPVLKCSGSPVTRAVNAVALSFWNDGVEPVPETGQQSEGGKGFAFGCLVKNADPHSDVILIQSASELVDKKVGNEKSVDLRDSIFYLRSNHTSGIIFRGRKEPSGGHAPAWYWRYSSHLYFVTTSSACGKSDNKNVPTLCRAFINENGVMMTEPVARGVERLEIAFGIDTNGDGIADRYSGNLDEDGLELTNAVTARITLLVRSTKPDYSYRNEKTYDLVVYDDDDAVYKPNDHYYRRIIRTTVILRNLF